MEIPQGVPNVLVPTNEKIEIDSINASLDSLEDYITMVELSNLKQFVRELEGKTSFYSF